MYVPLPPVRVSKKSASPPADPAPATGEPFAPVNPSTLPLILIVRSLSAFSAPVRSAWVLLPLIVTPDAILTMIGVVSVAAVYPAAVAKVRMFCSLALDVMSRTMAAVPWRPMLP